MLSSIYEIDDLQRLGEYLLKLPDREQVRSRLVAEFLVYARYKNAVEWNRAVRLCESLAIVGWGDHEPLEAVKGVYFNGNPNTFFINRYGQLRFVDAVWSKRTAGLAIDYGLSFVHEGTDRISMAERHGTVGELQDIRLCAQRNWIPKNPIHITRGIANCYENSKAVIESMSTVLNAELNRRMRPESYGSAINMITVMCLFSFDDGAHCKTNYIIADEKLKLKQKDFYPALREMLSDEEIEANGYYLRNRFTYGPFRRDTGRTGVSIVFEKAFSELPHRRQREVLCEYFVHAIERISQRLCGKVDYDFALMTADFKSVLHDWCHGKIPDDNQADD